MNLKQAMQRIEELERKVKELEARPEQHIHYHTHPVSPVYPTPITYPVQPFMPWGTPWCGAIGAGGIGTVTSALTFNG
jgi:hypothetical protein